MKKMLDVAAIESTVAEIARVGGSDDETAHAKEDALYVDVLTAIADGAEDPAALAAAALKAYELPHARWCA